MPSPLSLFAQQGGRYPSIGFAKPPLQKKSVGGFGYESDSTGIFVQIIDLVVLPYHPIIHSKTRDTIEQHLRLGRYEQYSKQSKLEKQSTRKHKTTKSNPQWKLAIGGGRSSFCTSGRGRNGGGPGNYPVPIGHKLISTITTTTTSRHWSSKKTRRTNKVLPMNMRVT